MKYYLIAGERSGDLHGSNLVKALKRNDPQAIFRGFGGDYMKEAGVDIVVHYADLAFMGFIEVVKNLRTVSRYIRQCKEDIAAFNPDVIILIDYGGFNMRIASFAKATNRKVFYYITPKVWAWNQKRAFKLRDTVTRMFVILPFEKDFFKRFGAEVDYVGNPVLDAVLAHKPDGDFLQRNRFDSSKPLVALLPGSRKQELLRIAPVMVETIKRLPNVNFGVASVSNLDDHLYDGFRAFESVRLIREDTYNLLQNAQAAIVTSGTATLETALLKVPQVVVYRTSAFTYNLVKTIIRVKFISLVNLIMGKEVIHELIQAEANPEAIAAEVNKLLFENSYREKVLTDYQAMFNLMNTGSASENAAKLMVEYLKSSRTTGHSFSQQS